MQDIEPWDNNVPLEWDNEIPADLLPAIRHLRTSFESAHFTIGHVTEILCYSRLHGDVIQDDFESCALSFLELRASMGIDAIVKFDKTVARGTPSAIFEGFFDFYLDGLSIQAFAIFNAMVEIGRAHESRLPSTSLFWAESQALHLIRSHTHSIDLWIRRVCDGEFYDPSEDVDEQMYQRKWQAPLFLILKPLTYDADRAWERADADSSLRWRKMFSEAYVTKVQWDIKKAAGNAALKLAMQPKAPPLSQAEELNHLSLPKPLLSKYRSGMKRAILIELSRNPSASDLIICRALDAEGGEELPKGWKKAPQDREFVRAYKDESIRPKIEKAVSKIRGDLRKAGLMPKR